jgi:hypothetical protein
LKIYQEFLGRTQQFSRQSLDDPAQQKMVAPVAWHVQLWLVDDGCSFHNLGPTEVHDGPITVPVPPDVPEESIPTLRELSLEATTMLTDLTEARPLILTELIVKNHYGG